jgi:prepilin signal peptidase PulO-like enzyme (type II secretory pathway)
MSDAPAVEAWFQGGGLLVALLPAAFILGLLLRCGLAAILQERLGGAARFPVIELAAVGVATAGWWWEVVSLGQIPSGVATADATSIGLRLVAHLSLFAFLAAASWIDLRHRVIPDAVTVPGVLAGLAWNASLPATLLPVGRAVERSFAPPTIEADVLGAFGPLGGAGLPGWLTGAAGLAAMLLGFAIWWWFGLPPTATDPADGQTEPWPRWLSPLIALGGGGGIVAAWLAGGHHWAGLVTAVVGLTVAAGMIWAVRAGASHALGREAMGFGDVTLMAMAGAWLGWQACLLACVLAVFIGLAHGLIQLVRHAESELPFGPSLCLGLAVVVVAWRPLWATAAPQFERPVELAAVVVLVIAMTAITLAVWARMRGTAA